MKCGRNKATAIIYDLADITKKSLAERMRTGPFTISTDGSNDDVSKQFPGCKNCGSEVNDCRL